MLIAQKSALLRACDVSTLTRLMQMLYYTIKIMLSATILVAVSEIAKRSSTLGALLASLPLTSLLAFVWLYLDTGDAQKVGALSADVFWLVLPSLPMFLLLPWLLKMGWGFWLSMGAAVLVTTLCYSMMLLAFKQFSGAA
jgi:hypothetical protein